MKIIKEEGSLVIKSWCNNPEDGAIEQAKNLAKLPFAFDQICLMPDTHQGFGMPIGGVMATVGVIVPNAVGVDIGCGMCFIKTTLKYYEVSVDTYKKIREVILKVIPTGFKHHKYPQEESKIPNIGNYEGLKIDSIVYQEYENALYQVGTLGGGNHFIELQKDENDFLCIMIHSGSRNLGKKVADRYNKIAIELNEKYYSKVPKKWGLSFLPICTKEAQNYIYEMQYCVDFALANREMMMYRSMDALKNCISKYENKNIGFESIINIAHNYASLENHKGHNVFVHRKGATRARKDEIGIIPGSQGTSSYIVRGLGNPESFMSCSHGAGRKLGRKQAQRELNLEEERAMLERQGILHSISTIDDLDEASGAYKSIDIVMEEQSDLVEPILRLEPLVVIKG